MRILLLIIALACGVSGFMHDTTGIPVYIIRESELGQYDTNLPAHWMGVSSYTVPSMIIKCIATSTGSPTASEWRIMYR